jgi:hypothetical protein
VTRPGIALALALAVVAWAPAQGPLPAVWPLLPEHFLEARLLELTNVERRRAGLAPVVGSSVLAQAARHHAEEMARLAYFSHVSPTEGRREPRDRVARMGGAQVAVGENLAAFSLRDLDVAERVIAGWMGSPGHRANLLDPAWTHAGFGLAEVRDGRANVVQLFAADPNPLVVAYVSLAAERRLAVRVEVAATAAGWVSFGGVDLSAEPVQVPAGGRATLVVEGLDAAEPTHLRLSWTPDRGSGFIGQQSGWFDPTSRAWRPDWQTQPLMVRVERYASTDPVPDVAVHLAFERSAQDLVVLVDGAAAPTTIVGTSVAVRWPGRPGVRTLEVGLRHGDGRVRLVHRFEVVVGDGLLGLR